jgi:steroid delta-isomerase-like uncharacterized protein
MSEEVNQSTTRRIIEVFNSGNLSGLDELFAENYYDHATPPGVSPDLPGVKQFFNALRTAFPDFAYTVEDEISEGDKVVIRVTGRGTMKGDFQGLPATGKSAEWQEIHFGRYENGKLVEHWANVDQLGMLQQLGLAPAPGQGG